MFKKLGKMIYNWVEKKARSNTFGGVFAIGLLAVSILALFLSFLIAPCFIFGGWWFLFLVSSLILFGLICWLGYGIASWF